MFREVVAALIRRTEPDGRKTFFICQRPETKARGLLWEFVGGKTEAGETKEQALIRECREELDVTVSVGKLYFECLHEYPDITIRLSLFACSITEGTLRLLEHRDAKWITPEEIPQYAFCPADEQILQKIQAEGL